jgi:hypothetical protein
LRRKKKSRLSSSTAETNTAMMVTAVEDRLAELAAAEPVEEKLRGAGKGEGERGAPRPGKGHC